MSTYTIDLEQVANYELRGLTLWLDQGDYESVVRIPRGARCTLWKRGRRRTINVGGINTITCTISGTAEQISPLWDELRDQRPSK